MVLTAWRLDECRLWYWSWLTWTIGLWAWAYWQSKLRTFQKPALECNDDLLSWNIDLSIKSAARHHLPLILIGSAVQIWPQGPITSRILQIVFFIRLRNIVGEVPITAFAVELLTRGHSLGAIYMYMQISKNRFLQPFCYWSSYGRIMSLNHNIASVVRALSTGWVKSRP